MHEWLESNAALPFETFVGLSHGQSERHWKTTARFEMRNKYLAQVANCYFPDLLPTRQAEEISQLYNRYRASAWARGECKLDQCAIRNHGTPRELFWRALKLHDASLSVERIRKIVVTS